MLPENDQEETKNENEFDSYQNQVQPYSRNQKIAVGVLAFFGVFVIIFWAVQFKSNIKLQHGGSANSDSAQNSTDNSAGFNTDDEALKTKDTDGDGLTDWDELHVYMTSPYLEDYDGDGYNDKQEIDTGNDPNCPRGQICNSVSNNSIASSSNIDDTGTIDNTDTNNQTNIINNTTNASSTDPNSLSTGQSSSLLSGKMDAKTLRKYLEDSGFDKSLLDQATDAEIMETYSRTFVNNN